MNEQPAAPGMDRPLGGAERQWWVQSQRASCNIVLVTCIDAPVDRARFEGAMAWLQRRYPLLAADLVVRDEEPRFVTGQCPPISVAWKERTTKDDWRAVGAKEVTTGFTGGPFIRFTVLAGGGGTDVLLAVSHMLADGLSTAQVLADVLRYLEDPGRPAEPVVYRGQVDERAPAAYKGKWLPFAKHVFEQIWQAPSDPARNARLAASYRGRDKVDWVSFVLEPDATERLRNKSREQGTTVQGALTAAMTLALGEREARHGRKQIAVHSPINIRALLDPPVVEEIGNYAAGTTKWLPTGAPLWDIARIVKADIDQAIARGAPFANERLAKGAKRSKPRTSPRWLALRVWPDLGVTNLGLVKPPETALGKRVTEMHVLTALPVMETLAAAVVTVHGRLFCDVHYCPDDVKREEVERIVASARRHLDSAVL